MLVGLPNFLRGRVMDLFNIVNRNHEISCMEDRLRAISARRKKKGGCLVQKVRALRSKS